MLTSRAVYSEVTSILESLRAGDLEEAKRRLQAVGPEANTERERGSVLAASGIYSSIAKAREGGMQSWDRDKLERALKSMTANQMADDFDKGYADTLLSYYKLTQKTE